MSGASKTKAFLQNLKSAEELEEEDREAQSAKLQELIRRGTPRDLAAAQELMKSLAGANPDAKPDYRGQALTELNKLEQKVILLNEMLDNFDSARNERFASGDAYDVRIRVNVYEYGSTIFNSKSRLSLALRGRRFRSGYRTPRRMTLNRSVCPLTFEPLLFCSPHIRYLPPNQRPNELCAQSIRCL